jgi:surface protein
MGYSSRKKSGKYNSGTKLVVPGQGILMVKMENGDKVEIKQNNTIIFLPSQTPTPSITPTNPCVEFLTDGFGNFILTENGNYIISEYNSCITPTPTQTPSVTPTNTQTQTPTPSITPSLTPTRTQTPTPSITQTNTPTPSFTPTPSTTPPPAFISIWDTTKTSAGSSNSSQVTLPYNNIASYTGTIDWGDGNVSANTFANRTHTYSSPGVYTITIVGTVVGFAPFNNGGDKLKLSEIVQWGNFGLQGQSLQGYWFSGCQNLKLSAVTDTIILGSTNDLTAMFIGCTSLTTINNSNSWDVSSVQSMGNMFSSCSKFNDSGITSWNVSNVTTMDSMFYLNTLFNQDLSGWCVTLIPSLPSNFATSTPAWVLPKPVWGTCP